MRSVALDFGGKVSFCEVANGKVIRRTSVKDFWELEPELGPQTAKAKVAVEACREAWFLVEQLRRWGHEPLVVDTTRSAKLGIGHHKRKNDRIDAEVLAHAVERNLIPTAHVLSPHRQSLRQWQSVRRALVETRAQYIVCVRGFLRAANLQRLPRCEPERFAKLARKAPMSANTRELITALVDTIADLSERIAQVDNRLEAISSEEPATLLLRTTPGVAAVVSTAFVSVIDEPSRFKRAHQVEAYLGLVPSEHTSVHRQLGSITKQGNKYLRALLIQAAWSILRTRFTDPLRIWAQRIAQRRGKKIAAVALARRLAGILWAMWRDGTVYEPARVGQVSAQGVERRAQQELTVAAAMRRAGVKGQRRIAAFRRAQMD